MKTQLTRIVELICDLAVSLWNLVTTAINKIWNSCRWRTLSALGKTMLSVFILAFIAVAGLVCKEYYKEYYGQDGSYYDTHFSEYIVIHEFNNNTFRVYNTSTGKYTTPKLEWIADAPSRDTLTVFSRKGKRGFLNINDGRIVIGEQYDKAWVFSEGLAAVVKDGKIGFINARNEVVIPFRYDYAYRNGRAIDYLFCDGYCTMTDERGACGLIDKEGNWIIEPLYDCIWTSHNGGYRIVKEGCKYGLLNPELQFAFPIEYDRIEFAADGTDILLSQNGRKWQTDFDGNVTRPFVVDYTNWIYMPMPVDREDEPAKLSDFIEYYVNDKIGVLRRDNGQVVIPAIYEYIHMLSETLFEALPYDDGGLILIDADGNVVNN